MRVAFLAMWLRRIATIIAVLAFYKLADTARVGHRPQPPAHEDEPRPQPASIQPRTVLITSKNPTLKHEHHTHE